MELIAEDLGPDKVGIHLRSWPRKPCRRACPTVGSPCSVARRRSPAPIFLARCSCPHLDCELRRSRSVAANASSCPTTPESLCPIRIQPRNKIDSINF